jgi:hypothetical protein
VSEDAKKPGHYLLSIHPPLEQRDGKTHLIEVKVLDGDKWRTLPIKWTAVFERVEPGRDAVVTVGGSRNHEEAR